jgi:hypothetical protein
VLSSSFDLAAFDPTLSYQFALGGLEDFLQQYGTRAIGASDVTIRTVTSGADLPLGVSFALSYSETDATRYQRITGATQPLVSSQTEWPAGDHAAGIGHHLPAPHRTQRTARRRRHYSAQCHHVHVAFARPSAGLPERDEPVRQHVEHQPA